MSTERSAKKGLFLALTLILVHYPCSYLFAPNQNSISPYVITGIIFALILFVFLVSKQLKNLFVTGFAGLFMLFAGEIILNIVVRKMNDGWMQAYVAGFFGSMVGLALAIIVTYFKIQIQFFPKREENKMDKSFKIKHLLYALVSALGFSYLVLPELAGISIPIFAIIQFLCLWFVVPNRKKLWFFIPIFILSLNYFISGNAIWQVSNGFVCIVLYTVMFLDWDIKNTSNTFLIRILENIVEPFGHFHLPFVWGMNSNKEKAPIIRRVLLALAVTLPCILLLILVLSNADMIFSQGVSNFFNGIIEYIRFSVLYKIVFGIVAGLYFFGLVYAAQCKKEEEMPSIAEKQGDLIILNILLVSVLLIYTIFVVIQFRYLFANVSLPYGLTYTEYARKGFFELLALTGVNIAFILFAVYLTKHKTGFWSNLTKWLLCYLCVITIILLVSSYYRMWLYNQDDGLTRLRFLVFGFLIFESFGLVITFFYIFKPKFNIMLVYLSIGLVYYLLLNLLPMDYYVAKSQVDRYLNGQKTGIAYTLTLSTDAAGQIARLYQSDDDDITKQVDDYFRKNSEYYNSFVPRWQRYNLSIDSCKKMYLKP